MSLFTRGQHCYILSVPSGYVKVGISDNVHRRLREVQAQCYEKVEFVMATRISQNAPVQGSALEQAMHLKMRPYAGERREWFKVSVDTAFDIMLTTYWFLATPPDHEDFGHFHPTWLREKDGYARERAALFWGSPGAPGHADVLEFIAKKPPVSPALASKRFDKTSYMREYMRRKRAAPSVRLLP